MQVHSPLLFYEIGQIRRNLVERMTWAQFASAYQELIISADVS